MVAATCSELRDVVDDGRQGLRRAISYHLHAVWRDQWAGELLVKLAEEGKTAEAI